MNGWEKWVGAAAVVVITLFIINKVAPASIRSQLGLN